METPDEDQGVDAVVGRLSDKYPGTSRDEIARLVDEEHRAFDGNPIRDYIPVLIEHRVRDRLEGLEVPPLESA